MRFVRKFTCFLLLPRWATTNTSSLLFNFNEKNVVVVEEMASRKILSNFLMVDGYPFSDSVH